MPVTKEDLDRARQDDMIRKEKAARATAAAAEKVENEAPRQMVMDAVDYLKGKVQDLSESDFAKGARNYGRMYKEGLGMKPETPYEKKKGGVIRSASARADGCAQRGKTRGKMY